MYMESMTPQKTSGSSVMRNGPGVMPWSSRAPKRIAVALLAGMPRVSSGMKADVAPALFAVSGPATPSMAP
jgi:hypothetical protein